MHHPVGTEIEATAKWLEEHAAPGAATVLRRVARQRDQARRELAAERIRNRYPLAWRSARRRARGARATVSELSEQLNDIHRQWDGDARRFTLHDQESARVNAMMRTELARLQVQAERAGWIPDRETRRLWRWREGWWELAYRKKNAKDGYRDSGWYLWGPEESYFGEWVAHLKADAMAEADGLITKHLATTAEAKP